MDRKEITQHNREAWNETMPYHQKGRKINLYQKFKDPQFIQLNAIERDAFSRVQIQDKRVIQLCCNNGIELISINRIGAKECIGVDISDEAIQEAQKFAEIANANCSFIRSDIYDILQIDPGTFDVVYISVGALCWLPDLPRLFDIISNLLNEHGHLVIFEAHPFTNVLGFSDDPGYNPDIPFNVLFSYFRKEPFEYSDGIDYIGGVDYPSKKYYNYSYTISAIINNSIRVGLNIIEFSEFSEDIACIFSKIEEAQKLPLSYLFIAQKK